jgi:hypothetical protein
MTCEDGVPHSGSRWFHGKDGVAGSIPAGGSTPNQQPRPGPAPGLLHVRRAPNRSLPAIASRSLSMVVRTQSVVTILSGSRSRRLTLAARCRHQFATSSSTPTRASAPWCTALLRRFGSSVERAAYGQALWRVRDEQLRGGPMGVVLWALRYGARYGGSRGSTGLTFGGGGMRTLRLAPDGGRPSLSWRLGPLLVRVGRSGRPTIRWWECQREVAPPCLSEVPPVV